MLARYTPAEARALESHYIRCAKAEGIWGMGKPPLSAQDRSRSIEAGTAAGIARQKLAKERKAKVLKAVRNGYQTASSICKLLSLSETCVRRYLNELGDANLIRIKSKCPMGGKSWVPVDAHKSHA